MGKIALDATKASRYFLLDSLLIIAQALTLAVQLLGVSSSMMDTSILGTAQRINLTSLAAYRLPTHAASRIEELSPHRWAK
jgi:ABC-type enterobactin transport system permease subunit